MSVARQFQIVYALMGEKVVSAGSLARELEVSVRTIYRDVEALSTAGIPVYAQPGKGGGISLMEGYALKGSLLNDSERQKLMLALKSISATDPAETAGLFKKLGALFQQDGGDWLSVDFSRWGSQAQDQEKFETVKRALTQKRILTFDYASSAGDVEARRVAPVRLMYKSQAWYLEAYCYAREGWRLFKLFRMRRILMGELYGAIPERPEVVFEPREGKSQRVVLRFSPRLAYRVYDEFDEGCVETLEDGTLRVTTEMPVDQWLLSHVLSFGAGVELVEPIWMRQMVLEASKNVFEMYLET